MDKELDKILRPWWLKALSFIMLSSLLLFVVSLFLMIWYFDDVWQWTLTLLLLFFITSILFKALHDGIKKAIKSSMPPRKSKFQERLDAYSDKLKEGK